MVVPQKGKREYSLGRVLLRHEVNFKSGLFYFDLFLIRSVEPLGIHRLDHFIVSSAWTSTSHLYVKRFLKKVQHNFTVTPHPDLAKASHRTPSSHKAPER